MSNKKTPKYLTLQKFYLRPFLNFYNYNDVLVEG